MTQKEELKEKKSSRLSVADDTQEDEFEKKIKQLKIMLKHEVISQEEYDAKIKEILSKI